MWFPLLVSLLTAAPQKVETGVYILSIGKFDIATGSYTVDFYLRLASDDVLGDTEVEFSNGRATMELFARAPRSTHTSWSCRVQQTVLGH